MLVKKHFAIPDGESVKTFDTVSTANYESCSCFLQAQGNDNTPQRKRQLSCLEVKTAALIWWENF